MEPISALLGSTAIGLLMAGALLTPRSRSLPFATAVTGVAALLSLGSAAFGWKQASLYPLVASGPVISVMQTLLALLGFVVAKFSVRYLAQEEGTQRFARWLLFTLASVGALVLSDNLVVLAVAWTATSISLHQLLTFYRQRRQAVLAAHKKFLVSRFADLCLWMGIAWVYQKSGTFSLHELSSASPVLLAEMAPAGVLFVLAAALKCAQMPFHGWLLQVMEAPTPVSALLHAGIVNIGGFLLIRTSAILSHSTAAQVLLAVIAGTTLVLATLARLQQRAVKTELAWSTSAQMGLMLMECAMGLWSLALFHLVAHSLYKSHAFLSSGSVVNQFHAVARSVHTRPQNFKAAITAIGGMVLTTTLAIVVAGNTDNLVWAFPALVFGLAALTSLTDARKPSLWFLLATGVGLVFAHKTMDASALVTTPSYAAWFVCALAVVLVFVADLRLRSAPGATGTSRFRRWLYAGCNADELLTRVTLRLWPPTLPSVPVRPELTTHIPGESR